MSAAVLDGRLGKNYLTIDLADIGPREPLGKIHWDADLAIRDRAKGTPDVPEATTPDELESGVSPLGRLSVGVEYEIDCVLECSQRCL